MKKENKQLILGIIGCVSGLGFICGFMATYIHFHKDSKTPLQWCVNDIQRNEDYAYELFYTYCEVHPKSQVQSERKSDKDQVYSYVITTYLDTLRTEWFCYIECFHRNTLDNALGTKTYRQDEIVCIDCDIVYEYDMENGGKIL